MWCLLSSETPTVQHRHICSGGADTRHFFFFCRLWWVRACLICSFRSGLHCIVSLWHKQFTNFFQLFRCDAVPCCKPFCRHFGRKWAFSQCCVTICMRADQLDGQQFIYSAFGWCCVFRRRKEIIRTSYAKLSIRLSYFRWASLFATETDSTHFFRHHFSIK